MNSENKIEQEYIDRHKVYQTFKSKNSTKIKQVKFTQKKPTPEFYLLALYDTLYSFCSYH